MRIFVSGGLGFLGSVLVPYLLEKGHQVTVLDSLLYGQRKADAGSAFVQGDIRDTGTMFNLLDSADVVIHLAAIVGEPACNVDIVEATEINFVATRQIAELCRERRRKVIFASTCSVYGANSGGLLTENSSIYPLSVYALSKIAAEEAILGRCSNAVVFRLGTLFGLSPRMRFDLVVNRFIAQTIQEKKITVLGGAQIRPFVHVMDVAEAFYRAVLSDASGIYNIGGTNIPILDLARKIQEEMPCEVSVYSEIRDPRNYAVDSNKAIETFGLQWRYGIANAVHETAGAYRSGSIVDYKDPQYSNELLLKRRPSKIPEAAPQLSPNFLPIPTVPISRRS
jgi:nucleoside-diphosphate-sugar epimerase